MAVPRKSLPLVSVGHPRFDASPVRGAATNSNANTDAARAKTSVARIFEPATVSTSQTRLRLIATGVVGLAAWIGLSLAITSMPDRPGENPCYRKAAERVLRGETFYRTDDLRGCFTYPPFMVLPYLPLTCLPDRAARAVWTMMNLGLLATIGWLTARLVLPIVPGAGAAPRLRPWMVAVAVGLLSLRVELSQLAYQGHDYYVYVFVMLAVSAWSAGASLRLGGFAGVAAACKATPLLFLPVFLWQRRWGAAAAMTACGGLATLLPDLLFPNPEGGLWVASWYQKFITHVDIGSAPEVAGAWNLWNPLNQSLSGTLYRLFTQVDDPGNMRWDASLVALGPAALRWLSIAAKLGVLGLLAFCTWPTRTRGLGSAERAFCALGQGGAVLCGMLLLSPMSSVQHFCFLLAPISFLVADFVYRRRDPLVGAAIAMFVISNLTCRDLAGSKLHVSLQVYGHLTWITLISMAVSGYVLEQRARAARAAADEADERSSAATVPLTTAGPRRRKAA